MLGSHLDLARSDRHVLRQLGADHVGGSWIDRVNELDQLLRLVLGQLASAIADIGLTKLIDRLLCREVVLAVHGIDLATSLGRRGVHARDGPQVEGETALLHVLVDVQGKPTSAHNVDQPLESGRVKVGSVDVLPEDVG
ncbi:hypothetical protein D3C72_1955460 [compost metagenome]